MSLPLIAARAGAARGAGTAAGAIRTAAALQMSTHIQVEIPLETQSQTPQAHVHLAGQVLHLVAQAQVEIQTGCEMQLVVQVLLQLAQLCQMI